MTTDRLRGESKRGQRCEEKRETTRDGVAFELKGMIGDGGWVTRGKRKCNGRIWVRSYVRSSKSADKSKSKTVFNRSQYLWHAYSTWAAMLAGANPAYCGWKGVAKGEEYDRVGDDAGRPCRVPGGRGCASGV